MKLHDGLEHHNHYDLHLPDPFVRCGIRALYRETRREGVSPFMARHLIIRASIYMQSVSS